MHVARDRGSVLLLWRCDTLCTSGFVDDVMFSHHGTNGPESSTTTCLEEVRQVAVPVERQTTTEFGRVHPNAALGTKSALYN